MEFCFIGDPKLKQQSEEISFENDSKDEIQEIIDNLKFTVVATRGVGLSAVQIGILKRIFVTNYGGEIKIFINPEFMYKSEEGIQDDEGCLSIPGVSAKVTRPSVVTIKFYDIDGNEHIETFEEIMARIIQHESDHLDGILFIDRLSPARKSVIRKKIDLARKNRQKHIEYFNTVIIPKIEFVKSKESES